MVWSESASAGGKVTREDAVGGRGCQRVHGGGRRHGVYPLSPNLVREGENPSPDGAPTRDPDVLHCDARCRQALWDGMEFAKILR